MPRISIKIRFLSGKFNFAKAKPAREELNIERRVVESATNKVFKI